MEWISVKDQLPPHTYQGIHDCMYLLAYVACPYYIGEVQVLAWMNNRFVGFPQGATDVTHWMYLPEPPEGE
jgi:hypothetical protein